MQRKRYYNDPPYAGNYGFPTAIGVRLPKQARSRDSFEDMLRAATEILREGGIEDLTVQEVIRRSGVGAGTFYARFETREAMIEFMARRLWIETLGEWSDFLLIDRWGTATVADVTRAFVRVLLAWSVENARVVRAYLLHAMMRPDGRLLEALGEVDNIIADFWSELVLSRPDTITAEWPEDRVRFGTLQLLATIRSRIIFAHHEADAGIRDDTLARELTRSFLTYIGAESYEP